MTTGVQTIPKQMSLMCHFFINQKWIKVNKNWLDSLTSVIQLIYYDSLEPIPKQTMVLFIESNTYSLQHVILETNN